MNNFLSCLFLFVIIGSYMRSTPSGYIPKIEPDFDNSTTWIDSVRPPPMPFDYDSTHPSNCSKPLSEPPDNDPSSEPPES